MQRIIKKILLKIIRIIAPLLSDKLFLQCFCRIKMGYYIDWNNPKTFCEKLQWLKLYDRNPEYVRMVDKVEVKKYIEKAIGKEYVIPTLAVFKSVDIIDFDALPSQFVLKSSHDSGGIVICKDKEKLDIKRAKRKLRKALQTNYFYQNREWPYKSVKPQIIAEKYMEDETGELKDYKLFCFNGIVKMFKIDFGRYTSHHANYYDIEGNLLPCQEQRYPSIPTKKLVIPHKLQEMIVLAEKLSKGIPFVRIDFYYVYDKIYFGEITFFPASGFGYFTPDIWNKKLGDLIKLPINGN